VVIHEVTPRPLGCGAPDQPGLEAMKAAQLLVAAQKHGREFCTDALRDECQIAVEQGYNITHSCFRSTPLNAAYHVSTIVYFWRCPMTA
jgi:hypothetical protein